VIGRLKPWQWIGTTNEDGSSFWKNFDLVSAGSAQNERNNSQKTNYSADRLAGRKDGRSLFSSAGCFGLIDDPLWLY